MQSFKTFSQTYAPDQQLLAWMDEFRQMVNDFVRIGHTIGASSYDSLSEAVRSRMEEFELDAAYKASATSRALRILKTYRMQPHHSEAHLPFCRKPMLACFKGLELRDTSLRMPGGVILHLNEYMAKSLAGSGPPRLVILTPTKVNVTVSRYSSLQHVTGMAGIDINTDNLTLVDTSGKVIRYGMEQIPATIEKCLRAKRGFRRRDARVRAALFSKYGQIERDRLGWITHNVSSRIVSHARKNGLAIAIEDINGIRRLYTRGAGHSRAFLRKRHAWPFFEIRRQLTYKSAWQGIPLVTVNAEYTSAECSLCGGRTVVCPDNSKGVRCSSCGKVMDRDENAARNILRRGLRSRLRGSASEAVTGKRIEADGSHPGADADQPAGSPS